MFRFLRTKKAVDVSGINDKNNILAMYFINVNYTARIGLKKGWWK